MPHIQAYDWNNIARNVDNEASYIHRVRSAEYSTASSVASMEAASMTPTPWVSPGKTVEAFFSYLTSTTASAQMNAHASQQATNAIDLKHLKKPLAQIHSTATEMFPASSLGFQSSHDRQGSTEEEYDDYTQEEYDDYTQVCHEGEEEEVSATQ